MIPLHKYHKFIVEKNFKTYFIFLQVIPLTSSLGIIQWVEHTVSLEDFIKISLPGNKNTRILNAVGDKYVRFLEKGQKNFDQYGLTAQKKNRNKVIPFYRGLVNEISLDVLRYWFEFRKKSFNSYYIL